MAALNALEQHLLDPSRDGTYLVVTRTIRSAAVSDTLELPEGAIVAAELPNSGGTAATVTVSGTSATITGGLPNVLLRVVSLHVGNAAGL